MFQHGIRWHGGSIFLSPWLRVSVVNSRGLVEHGVEGLVCEGRDRIEGARELGALARRQARQAEADAHPVEPSGHALGMPITGDPSTVCDPIDEQLRARDEGGSLQDGSLTGLEMPAYGELVRRFLRLEERHANLLGEANRVDPADESAIEAHL